jgi:hypothetical protein
MKGAYIQSTADSIETAFRKVAQWDYIFSRVMLRLQMIPLVAITFATIGKNIFTRGYYEQ